MTCGNNPNHGNRWSDGQKQLMSHLKRKQHSSNSSYGDEWKSKISKASREFWKNNPDKKKEMASKVKRKKQKYRFIQMDDNENILRVWDSMDNILTEHPEWKWQNIYSVCNGYKKRIYGYKWRKELKNED